jgi:hypothetical protein
MVGQLDAIYYCELCGDEYADYNEAFLCEKKCKRTRDVKNGITNI